MSDEVIENNVVPTRADQIRTEAADLYAEPDKGPAAAPRDDSGTVAPQPIDYGDFAVPEGVTVDQTVLGQAIPLFQEMSLPKDQAQKVVDLYVQVKQAESKTHQDAWQQAIAGWRSELKADAAFGGANLPQTVSSAAKAIDAYGGKDAPAIREFMKAYGLGDHPAFARFLARVGRSVTEDRLPRAQGGPAQKVTARDLYPNSNMS